MAVDELPLFSWRKPSAALLVFPLSRRVGKIRRVADVLSRKHGRDAEAYWHRIVSDHSRQLADAGLPSEAIEFQLIGFRDAVEGELRRLAFLSSRPGGAA